MDEFHSKPLVRECRLAINCVYCDPKSKTTMVSRFIVLILRGGDYGNTARYTLSRVDWNVNVFLLLGSMRIGIVGYRRLCSPTDKDCLNCDSCDCLNCDFCD